MRELVNSMFISNNRPSIHLWGKKNLVKPQKVSKYYENDCGRWFEYVHEYEYINGPRI